MSRRLLNVWEAGLTMPMLSCRRWRRRLAAAEYRLASERLLCAESGLPRADAAGIVSLSVSSMPCLLARNAVNPWLWRSLRGVSCALRRPYLGGEMMDAAQRQQVRHFALGPCWLRESITSAVSILR